MSYRIVEIDGVSVVDGKLSVDPGYTISGTLVVDDNNRLMVDTGVTISGGKVEVHDSNLDAAMTHDGDAINTMINASSFGSSSVYDSMENHIHVVLEAHTLGRQSFGSLAVSDLRVKDILELLLYEQQKTNVYLSQIVGDELNLEDIPDKGSLF